MRRAAALAVVLALAAAGPAPAQDPPKRADLADLADEVMCTVCGVPLELAHEAPQAQRQRAFIRGLIAEGRTKEEIKDALVDEYGEQVLAVPGTEGFDLAAWVVPIAAFATAALLIGIAVRRWRRKGGPAGPPAPSPAPDPEASKRLDEDMGRYEL